MANKKVDPLLLEYRKAVGVEVNKARYEQGYTLASLSKATKINYGTVYNVELGKAREEIMIKMCNFLNVDYKSIKKKVGYVDQPHRENAVVTVPYRVGGKKYLVTGKEVSTTNEYENLVILEIMDDGGLKELIPHINRIAVHKSEIQQN